MPIEVEVENVSSAETIPMQADFEQWAAVALRGEADALVSIRLVDEKESAELNKRYRNKSGATNVLSFPADLPEEVDLPLLGDLVICSGLVIGEALAQSKSAQAHWAHLVIHGMLHLQGFDHQSDDEAVEMETLETDLLHQLGFPDPYA